MTDLTASLRSASEIVPLCGKAASEIARLTDKVDGLDSELRSAVQVAYLRGATEWAERNYPKWMPWLRASAQRIDKDIHALKAHRSKSMRGGE